MIDDELAGGCASCMTRRTFMERVAVAAAATIAAGCGVTNDITAVGSGPLPNGPITVRISDYAGLAVVGQPVEVKSAGVASGVAAVRTGASSFIALGMACTHEGTKVGIVGTIFDCPNHGARFSSTGAVTNGPATRALSARTVVYDQVAGTLVIS